MAAFLSAGAIFAGPALAADPAPAAAPPPMVNAAGVAAPPGRTWVEQLFAAMKAPVPPRRLVGNIHYVARKFHTLLSDAPTPCK